MLVFRLLQRPKLVVRIKMHGYNSIRKFCLYLVNTGIQVNVKPSVCTDGMQCSLSVQEIGIQCSLASPSTSSVYHLSSSPIPSDSSQSKLDQQETTDHDISAFTLQDDSSL